MTQFDRDTVKRAMRLRELMNEYLRTRSPQERDRTMQAHLAQARGPVQNAVLLRQMTNAMLKVRSVAKHRDSSDG